MKFTRCLVISALNSTQVGAANYLDACEQPSRPSPPPRASPMPPAHGLTPTHFPAPPHPFKHTHFPSPSPARPLALALGLPSEPLISPFIGEAPPPPARLCNHRCPIRLGSRLTAGPSFLLLSNAIKNNLMTPCRLWPDSR